MDECGERARLNDSPVITALFSSGVIVRVDVTPGEGSPDATDPALSLVLTELESEGLALGASITTSRPDLASQLADVPASADGLAGDERAATVHATDSHSMIVSVDAAGLIVNLRWGTNESVRYLFECA